MRAPGHLPVKAGLRRRPVVLLWVAFGAMKPATCRGSIAKENINLTQLLFRGCLRSPNCLVVVRGEGISPSRAHDREIIPGAPGGVDEDGIRASTECPPSRNSTLIQFRGVARVLQQDKIAQK
jgi:hypothetical protein